MKPIKLKTSMTIDQLTSIKLKKLDYNVSDICNKILSHLVNSENLLNINNDLNKINQELEDLKTREIELLAIRSILEEKDYKQRKTEFDELLKESKAIRQSGMLSDMDEYI